MEAAFPATLALAVICLGEKRLMPPLSPDDPLESAAAEPVERIAVSCWGHHRGEGLALVEAVA
jgi:3-oxoacyl-[acyl-carrier-protein] synthase II